MGEPALDRAAEKKKKKAGKNGSILSWRVDPEQTCSIPSDPRESKKTAQHSAGQAGQERKVPKE